MRILARLFAGATLCGVALLTGQNHAHAKRLPTTRSELAGMLNLLALEDMSATQSKQYPCYIAFIHGSGTDDSGHPGLEASTGWGSNAFFTDTDGQERYWSPDGNLRNSLSWEASRQWDVSSSSSKCMVWRAAYDGVHLGFPDGAAQAGEQIAEFITRYAIPDKKLIIVTHSMGGLVGRYILNSSYPTAPGFWAPFQKIGHKTKFMITLAGPHTGSQAADAMFGEADFLLSNVASALAKWLGIQNETQARNSIRRAYIEAAAGGLTGSGWLADFARNIRIYTVSGVDPTGGNNTSTDSNLTLVAESLCHRVVGWNHSQCPLIPIDPCTRGVPECGDLDSAKFFHGANYATDGLVEFASGHAYWMRDSPSAGFWYQWDSVPGDWFPWLFVRHNHDQVRYDLVNLPTMEQDPISGSMGQTVGRFIGTFIGSKISKLPQGPNDHKTGLP